MANRRPVVIAGIDQTQDGSPQEDARQKFAQHGRLADPAGRSPQEPRCGQHDCQDAQQLDDLMRVHGRFRRGDLQLQAILVDSGRAGQDVTVDLQSCTWLSRDKPL